MSSFVEIPKNYFIVSNISFPVFYNYNYSKEKKCHKVKEHTEVK